MEALITLDCSNYSENMVDILKVFQQIEWGLYNPQGRIEYLPVGDDDEYNWQCEIMPEIRFYDIINDKIANKELVGVRLFYNNGDESISLLAYDTKQIILGIENRKTIDERHTDMIWYLKNIIYKLFEQGIRLLSYKLEEFED